MELDKLTVQAEFLDGIKVPIYIKNSQGVYVYCNSAFSKLVGVPANKIIGANTADIIPNKKIAKTLVNTDKALREEVERDQKLNIQPATPPSATTDIALEKSVIYGSNHELAGIIGTVNLNTDLDAGKHSEVSTLSKRERAILERLSKGESVKQIANNLHISTHTVADHKKSIFLKLGVHTTGEAVYKAIAYLAATKLSDVLSPFNDSK